MGILREYISDDYSSNQSKDNYDKYVAIIDKYPYVKTIVEDILKCTPEYRIKKINVNTDKVNIWFTSAGSMIMFFGNYRNVELMSKHEVFIQVPGNGDVAFSLGITIK